MATTNLISKSLGDILTESGTGTPDHTSPIGSTYVDVNTNVMYSNTYGVWQPLNFIPYAKLVLTGNTNQLTGIIAGSFYSLGTNNIPGINWSLEYSSGFIFSATTGKYTLTSDVAGTYYIITNATFNQVTSTSNYEMAISIDSVISPYSISKVTTQASGTGDRINTTQMVGFYGLSGGTTVGISVSNELLTTNILISEANLTMYRIYDNI